MGSALCTVFKQEPVKVLYFGLDAAGKTTLLYRLKLGELVTTIPTIGFNIETMNIGGMEMTSWDVGLRCKGRALYRHYLDGADAMVFMIDSSDHERLNEAVDDFFGICYPVLEQKPIPILVLANKQDRPKVMSPTQIKEAIYKQGDDAFRNRATLEVFPTVATTLQGVDSGFQWLAAQLALRIAQKSYLSSISLSKIAQYPAVLFKSSYLRITGLLSGPSSQQDSASNILAKESPEAHTPALNQ